MECEPNKGCHFDLLRGTLSLPSSRANPTPQISTICQRVFTELGGRPNALKDMLSLARSSFEDTRIAAYAVIKSVAVHGWGLEVSESACTVGGPFMTSVRLLC